MVPCLEWAILASNQSSPIGHLRTTWKIEGELQQANTLRSSRLQHICTELMLTRFSAEKIKVARIGQAFPNNPFNAAGRCSLQHAMPWSEQDLQRPSRSHLRKARYLPEGPLGIVQHGADMVGGPYGWSLWIRGLPRTVNFELKVAYVILTKKSEQGRTVTQAQTRAAA